jgi:hypothetical protein
LGLKRFTFKKSFLKKKIPSLRTFSLFSSVSKKKKNLTPVTIKMSFNLIGSSLELAQIVKKNPVSALLLSLSTNLARWCQKNHRFFPAFSLLFITWEIHKYLQKQISNTCWLKNPTFCVSSPLAYWIKKKSNLNE